MKKTYFLCRHGQTRWNEEKRKQGGLDSELNQKGILFARKLAKSLTGLDNPIIISSPLGRAKKTAEFIQKYNGYSLIIDYRISEMSFGVFEGLTEDEIFNKYNKTWNELRSQYIESGFPEGESIINLQERCFEFVQSLNNLKYNNIIIVGHEDVNSVIFSILTNSSSIQPNFKQPNSLIYQISGFNYKKKYLYI